MLEEVASCAMTRLTYPWLLVVAGLCVLGGLVAGAQNGGGPIAVGVFFALVCGVAYLLSRQQVVVIASAGQPKPSAAGAGEAAVLRVGEVGPAEHRG